VILRLDSLPWPSVPARPVVLVPLGSTEQHGPHLPFDVDTRIAVAVCDAVASAASGEVVVTPPLAFGASGEHQGFAGTVSIGRDALHFVIVELVRSLSTWAGRIVFVNGHGGNASALASAIAQLRAESHDAGWVPCAVSPGDAHAGLVETAIMLHLDPDRVDVSRLEPGDTRPIGELMDVLRAQGVREVSPNGILGDPRGADAATGAALLARMIDDVGGRLRSGRADPNGLLAVAGQPDE
jgi:creatinine amidohydrolase